VTQLAYSWFFPLTAEAEGGPHPCSVFLVKISPLSSNIMSIDRFTVFNVWNLNDEALLCNDENIIIYLYTIYTTIYAVIYYIIILRYILLYIPQYMI